MLNDLRKGIPLSAYASKALTPLRSRDSILVWENASRPILTTEAGRVTDVRFDGGCHGNTQGIVALVKGMKIEDVIERLDGIRCKSKLTSCPDQLARALRQAL